jgi:DNA-binding LytR/AlgR family response regulator
MPLRDVIALLPSGFVQAHRSHVVNLEHVQAVKRKNRNVRLVLSAGAEIPVSRHRLHRVLPLLRQRLEAVQQKNK